MNSKSLALRDVAMKPHFHFVTLFPSIIEAWFDSSILGRARKAGIFDFSTYQLRDFSTDRHRSVDDLAYGGGGGMVLRVEPLVAAVEHIRGKVTGECCVIYFSPAGEPMTTPLVQSFVRSSSAQHLILICGHYEGVDQRFLENWVDREISLGDFVVTGGELPAMAFGDAVIRQIDGCLSHDHARDTESFSLMTEDGKRVLEYPHYTRPASFRGIDVPEVLLGGNHRAIAQWRQKESVSRTADRRPDLLANAPSGGVFDKANPTA